MIHPTKLVYCLVYSIVIMACLYCVGVLETSAFCVMDKLGLSLFTVLEMSAFNWALSLLQIIVGGLSRIVLSVFFC